MQEALNICARYLGFVEEEKARPLMFFTKKSTKFTRIGGGIERDLVVEVIYFYVSDALL